MECLHCKGRLVKGTAPFAIDHGGYHLHWDAVPAWVCTQCGEPLFEGREVDVIQETIKALDALKLSKQDKRRIYFGNAVRMLRLKNLKG